MTDDDRGDGLSPNDSSRVDRSEADDGSIHEVTMTELATASDEAEVETPDTAILLGRRIAFAGRLGGMNRREAANLLRSYGAVVIESEASPIDWLIIGAEESPLAEAELVRAAIRHRPDHTDVVVLRETELWQQLGLVDAEQSIRQLYTPAMLAQLLGVSVRVIRRWHRRGLIRPVRTLHRLPYFDFQEIATARRLAQWIASGAKPETIERRLMEIVDVVPDARRPLDQLSILIEGKHVLLRQGEGLIEPGGQLRFDFDAFENDSSSDPSASDPSILRFQPAESIETDRMTYTDSSQPFGLSLESDEPSNEDEDDLLMSAYLAEDEGDLETAVDCYHAILARDGWRADIHFQIAELLYRLGEPIAARERYYAALEVDPDYVEARASLAGVLAETGQLELAVAAYQGALALHDDYAEVHYSLGMLLDQLDRSLEARHHWQRFLQLSPQSPWADEARARLESPPTE